MAVKMELYRIFREVARTQNLSAAGEHLFISQSAVSQSIKQLEQQLQTLLFTRTPRGVILTPDGKLLLEYVSKALDLLQFGEEKLSKSRSLEWGHLTIGASDTLTRRYLLPVLKTFHQNYPAVHLEIRNGTSEGVLNMLQNRRVDIAFSTSPADSSIFNSHRCFATHLVFVASPDYPCDFNHTYTLSELADFPLILLDYHASSRKYMEKIFLQHGISLSPAFELGTHDLQIALARIGLGVAGVTQELSLSPLGRGVVKKLRIAQAIPPRQVEMCSSVDLSPSVAAQTFMDMVIAHNAKLAGEIRAL